MYKVKCEHLIGIGRGTIRTEGTAEQISTNKTFLSTQASVWNANRESFSLVIAGDCRQPAFIFVALAQKIPRFHISFQVLRAQEGFDRFH